MCKTNDELRGGSYQGSIPHPLHVFFLTTVTIFLSVLSCTIPLGKKIITFLTQKLKRPNWPFHYLYVAMV